MPLPGEYEFTADTGRKLLRRIEWCARVSHGSEDATAPGSFDRFLRSVVLQHGDWSVVEHASVSVDFLVDRGVSHELVRHRLFSYTQSSTRFINYAKKIPPTFVGPFDISNDSQEYAVWDRAIHEAESSYKQLIALGIAPQLARSVFPTCLSTRIIVTGNLRSWRWFLLARTSKACHPQMLDVTIPLLKEFQEKIPILFEDIEAGQAQSEAFKKPH